MRWRFKDILKSLLFTIVILTIMEIFSSTMMPILGLSNFRMSFNVLLVLYLVLRINSIYLPYCILVLQLFHSLFSIEGWAIGTIAGVIISIIIGYIKDLIHFSNSISTMIIVQISQLGWILITSILTSLKLEDFGVMPGMIGRFIVPSILISIISPFIFKLLDTVWKPSGNSSASFGH